MKLFNFFHNSIDYWVIGILLVIALVFFIRDFKLTSIRSWLLLFGIFAVGAIAIFSARRNKRLLEELKKKEKELDKLGKNYEKQKEANKLTEKNYQLAKKELEEQKKKTAVDILRSNDKYEKEAVKLEKELAESTPEEMLKEVENYLSR